MRSSTQHTKQHGFTLLEIMLVLLLMGLVSSYVMVNAFSVSQSDRLKEQARRLQVIVDMASDYAVLNQLQLGIRIEEASNSYFFMYLDDNQLWQPIANDPIYEEQVLPEEFELALELDELPWQEAEQLFDRALFDEESGLDDIGTNIGNDEEKRLPPPQILLMSSGEVTPFSLAFMYEPRFGNDDPVYFYVNNEDLPPLVVDGPLAEPYDD
jgi:general secretion pathway protein H